MQTATVNQPTLLNAHDLLRHWLGHRRLTRRIIEVFPEDAFFNYSIGGMRTCAELVKELLAIAVPGLNEIVSNRIQKFDESHLQFSTKEAFLSAWDDSTAKINTLWQQISHERFQETINLFGQYEFPIIESILYFIDNEIHHRGQAFVYLRALGIEPPYFWER